MAAGLPSGVLSEKTEQARILELLEAMRARVYVSGTVRPRADSHHGTCQTPGIPDITAFLPAPISGIGGGRPLRLVFIEVKRQGGRLRPEQAIFRDHCTAAGIAHITGGLDALMAWLEVEGYRVR